MKKWLILFSILIFPYLLIQVFEKATHNILTLGYVEKSVLITDSEGNITEKNDSVKVPKFQLLNQDEKYISNIDLLGFNYI